MRSEPAEEGVIRDLSDMHYPGGTPVNDKSQRRLAALPRCPDGTVDNCSLKFGEPAKDCQMCDGTCPDSNIMGEYVQPNGAVGPLTRSSGSRDPEDRPDALAEGDEVELAWGEATYTPVKFCTFTVGPFTARTTVRLGESGDDALNRLRAFLRRASDESFAEQLSTFLKRVEEAAREADKAAERSRGR